LPFQGMQPEGIDKTQRMRRILQNCRRTARAAASTRLPQPAH
jgi:hypothetical protein